MDNRTLPPPQEATQVSPLPTTPRHNTLHVVKGHVKQAQGPRDPPGITPGAAGALAEAPMPPRARGPSYWPPCLAHHPSRFWGNRHPLSRLHSSPCNKGHYMDPCPTPGARVTHYGVLLSPRDQDTTSCSPPITLPNSYVKRSHDSAGIAFPASNYRELTTGGGIGPTDPCNPLSNRGGNTHTHYEPSAPGMHRHGASHMTKQTGQTYPGNYPRLYLGTSASISWHTQIQTHDTIRVFKALNNPAFRRPSRYISIYANAYIGIPSTLTPSAPHSRDAATPVTVHLRIASLACDTRHYRPPTSEVHPETAPLLRDAALSTGCFVNKQVFTAKGG